MDLLEEANLKNSTSIANGRHLVAARTLAALKQTELARLASLHVNSLKRLERMARIERGWAIEKIEKALQAEGIICQCWPTPSIREAEGT